MPTYQNASVNSNQLILGNYKIETASSSAGSYVNLGAGQLTAFQHNFTNSDIQAGNAVDPIEFIAEENVTIAFELMEYKASAMSAMMGGLTETTSISTTSTTIRAGGAVELTPRAFKLTNKRMIGTTTVNTVITIFNANIENGMTLVPKSDNDGNPVNVFQFTVKGDNLASLSAGAQLFQIVKVEVSE